MEERGEKTPDRKNSVIDGRRGKTHHTAPEFKIQLITPL